MAQVMLNCSNRWLGIALDYLGAIIVFVAILSALITASLSPAGTSSSLIGLAINYALLVPIYLNWVVKLTAEMEMYVGAVERIQFCIESSQERYRERSGVKCELLLFFLNGKFHTKVSPVFISRMRPKVANKLKQFKI